MNFNNIKALALHLVFVTLASCDDQFEWGGVMKIDGSSSMIWVAQKVHDGNFRPALAFALLTP